MKAMLLAALSALAMSSLLTGCSTPPKATGIRFHAQAQASLVICYGTDACSSVEKPAQKEGEFTLLMTRQEILKFADTLPSRDLAVVSMPIYLDPGLLTAVVNQWKTDLQQLRFDRIVFVQGASRTKSTDGTLIIATVPDERLALRSNPDASSR
jgi:hypothetical protein